MRGRLATAFAAIGLLGAMGSPASAQELEGVSVEITPARIEVVLGGEIELELVVTNLGTEPSQPLVAHIDITDPSQATSVDPEDWTPTLTRRVGVVGSGKQVSLTWPMQPIAGGDFIVYATVFSAEAEALVASAPAHIAVAEQRSLNPGGILPVAIGAPAAVGVLLLAQTRSARRRDR